MGGWARRRGVAALDGWLAGRMAGRMAGWQDGRQAACQPLTKVTRALPAPTNQSGHNAAEMREQRERRRELAE